jgi:NAD-dependent deacetylase
MDRKLAALISDSSSIVFFGGAGISTESGIPDFRSASGLYNKKYDYPPEVMLSHTFFEEHTKEFFDFYRRNLVHTDAKPNAAHIALATLESAGKLKAVITQNIDGLHQAAGSRSVLELHGSVMRNYCTKCGKFYPLSAVTGTDGVPRCSCGGVIKPDVVLYEEALNDDTVSRAVDFIRRADMLIIGGTSLNVYPAAGLIRYFSGKHLVLINRDPTPADGIAELVYHKNAGDVLGPGDNK